MVEKIINNSKIHILLIVVLFLLIGTPLNLNARYSYEHITGRSDTLTYAGNYIYIYGSCDIVNDSNIQNIDYYHVTSPANNMYYFTNTQISVVTRSSTKIHVRSNPSLLRKKTNEVAASDTLDLTLGW